MVYDHLKNVHLYFPLSERIENALRYCSETNFANMEPGKYEVEGENIYALVSEYNTKPSTSGKWEAHKKYIDIQIMISGKEKMGFTESQKVIVINEYDSEKDCTIYKGEGNFLIADEKHFAIFFPTDIHMPGMAINIPKAVKKVVVKVRTEYQDPVEDAVEDINEEIKPEESEATKSEE